MKSTYKLIGAYWDHVPLPAKEASLSYDSTYLPADSPLCLFDLIEKKRRIGISELLAADSDTRFSAIVDDFDGCDAVAILLDYQPSCGGSILRRFYHLRALQAYGKLASALPDSDLVFMLPKDSGDNA